MPPQKQRKVALMGSRAVGKSTVTVRFVDDLFVESYNPTIENTFHKVIKFRGEEFNTEIVDTAGQDEYSIFQRQYSVGIHGYILVYSVTSKSSFEMVKVINDKILNALGTDYVPRVLVGNKTDLYIERQITTEEGRALAAQWKCAFVETSAKNNENIVAIFTSLLSEIQQDAMPEEQSESCVLL
uniref:Uncharacterized protein n=1 Tax=Arcella intermedia TaxID=1963864 RepID=A0A6B2LKS8_9EUKA|eukprot:TRINITY_DN2296_c0_g1_i1.p1 TRINITY_DN2296_c0_g1~~TRINITY_DN2296_c0_g1_i1.p1  ORF type:complete len:184 (-),score=27.94 TRINITY_DN2296_c0_g1_i1:77-628(-)